MFDQTNEWLGRFPEAIRSRINAQVTFWEGTGPSLLFIPISDPSFATGEAALYGMDGYPERFNDPDLMFESEKSRADKLLEWPTDGIPTMRPNLSTVFVPGSAGQEYVVQRGAMPWIGRHFARGEIRSLRSVDLTASSLFRRAAEFYKKARGYAGAVPYQADGQGVFDIAHLLYGHDIFLDLATEEEADWIDEVLEISLELFVSATDAMKREIGEPRTSMIHGHGTPQGLFFPVAGTRISEDTATLLSPQMIEEKLMPSMRASAEKYSGAFVHYCGYHPDLFKMLCDATWCVAIDLGNPEAYDFVELAEQAARTGTVLYSRVAPVGDENWREFVTRVGGVIRTTGLRAVVRPTVFPAERSECDEMLDTFHSLTSENV